MQIVFNGNISRLNMVKKKISKLEDKSIETFQTEMKGEKRIKNEKKESPKHPKPRAIFKVIIVIGLPEEERQEQKR